MDQQRGTEIAENAERVLHLPAADGRKVVGPGVGEEALEPQNAGLVQGRELAEVAGDHTAPESDIDVTLSR